ncbi:DUF4432 family protein [uncultured Amnibacterium sp.]|uniref:DUF4432 family protein n=1 Tax=uncultured Amnibacterium sp. TaxID=1631851 RepID=UPI0035CA870C
MILPERGSTITSISRPGGANILWNPPDADHGPAPDGMPEPGDRSSAEFERSVFAGGWFPMFPSVGPPGGDARAWLHGEAPWLRWQVEVVTKDGIELRARTPASGLALTRWIHVSDERVLVRTEALNASGLHRRVSWGEHPCFSRTAFAGGSVLVAPSLSRSASSADPARTRIPPSTRFAWPILSGLDDTLDFSVIPARSDGREEHVLLTIPSGRAALRAPDLAVEVELEWDAGSMPHALLWQHFRPDDDGWDVFALEPASCRARTHAEADRAGHLVDLPPGAMARWAMSLSIRDVGWG